MGFLAFSKTPGDVLLLETGIGGRLDATNVIADPLACVITPLGLDHQDMLGPTLDHIAHAKAGIVKPGAPVFVAAPSPVIRSAVLAENPTHYFEEGTHWSYTIHEDHWCWNDRVLPHPHLQGGHQYQNAALALAVATHLFPQVSPVLAQAMSQVRWPGRLEQFDYKGISVLFDGAHNELGAVTLARYLGAHPQKRILLFAMRPGRDACAVVAPLLPHVEEIWLWTHEDFQDPSSLELFLQGPNKPNRRVRHMTEVSSLMPPHTQLVITGSLYLYDQVGLGS
jgi:dihydrofolate synthase/folylpolyglutamate synthase